MVSQKLGRFFKTKQKLGTTKLHSVKTLITKRSSNKKIDLQKNSDKRAKAA